MTCWFISQYITCNYKASRYNIEKRYKNTREKNNKAVDSHLWQKVSLKLKRQTWLVSVTCRGFPILPIGTIG